MCCRIRAGRGSPNPSSGSSGNEGGFGEGVAGTMSTSLEDLVSHFDEKIKECFKNYKESTDEIAPIPIRTQEEIMSDSQYVILFQLS